MSDAVADVFLLFCLMICLFVVILHSRHISYHVHSIPSTSFGHGHDGFSFAFYRFINKLFIVINSHVAWLHALNVCACLTFFNFIITLWYNLSACSAVFNALYITEKGTQVIFLLDSLMHNALVQVIVHIQANK